MTKQIMFEVCENKKRELSNYLKENGFSNKHVEKLELHFQHGELSLVKPILRF